MGQHSKRVELSRQLRWGATGEELRTALAGDDLITAPDLTATRAITIHAAWVP